MQALIQITGLNASTLLLLGCVAALLLGALLGWLLTLGGRRTLERERDRLVMKLESEQRISEERQQAFEQARLQLQESFSHLSSEALRKNNEQFLQLANTQLKQQHSEAQTDLEKRQVAIKNLLDPIRESLNKNEKQIREIEKERKEAYGNINQYLQNMQNSQKELRLETQNLVKALRRPEVRGQWGEIQLRRLLELAGMLEHCDFDTQVSKRGDEGLVRPDVVVHLPEKRQIVIDAKTPLDAYLDAIETEDELERRGHLQRHLRKVKERIDELSRKNYWGQFERSPEFVVLFLPGEQYWAAALDQDPALLEKALSLRVIVATPASLLGLLKAVAYSWRQLDLIENAEQIRALGVELHDRVATFTEHLSKVGNTLKSSVSHYNKAIGSLESRVLPSATRFRELGISSAKDIETPKKIDQQVKE